MKAKDFMDAANRIAGYESIDLCMERLRRYDVFELIRPCTDGLMYWDEEDEQQIMYASGGNAKKGTVFTLTDLANVDISPRVYAALSCLWHYPKAADSEKEDDFKDLLDFDEPEREKAAANIAESKAKKPPRIRQKEQHAFFEELMREMRGTDDAMRALKEFLAVGLVDYMRYLKLRFSVPDMKKYAPYETLHKIYDIYKNYKTANGAEPLKLKLLLVISPLFAAEDDYAAEDDRKYIIDKLFIEPFKMLGKEKQ